jgi:hypothetical protein
MKNHNIVIRILLASFVFYWIGCWGSSTTPRITLNAVDCEKDKIQITAAKTVSGSTSNWVVLIEVTVKCDGAALPNAEFKFTPWIGDPLKLTTDNQGKGSYRKQVGTSERPGNLTVEVEVEGSDGMRTESITV